MVGALSPSQASRSRATARITSSVCRPGFAGRRPHKNRATQAAAEVPKASNSLHVARDRRRALNRDPTLRQHVGDYRGPTGNYGYARRLSLATCRLLEAFGTSAAACVARFLCGRRRQLQDRAPSSASRPTTREKSRRDHATDAPMHPILCRRDAVCSRQRRLLLRGRSFQLGAVHVAAGIRPPFGAKLDVRGQLRGSHTQRAP
jgi:hypothetical protein